jgi:hypothetical protein
LHARVGAAAVDDYAYLWPLQTAGDSAAWQLELTPEVYAALRSGDLRDLAVLNAAGNPDRRIEHGLVAPIDTQTLRPQR